MTLPPQNRQLDELRTQERELQRTVRASAQSLREAEQALEALTRETRPDRLRISVARRRVAAVQTDLRAVEGRLAVVSDRIRDLLEGRDRPLGDAPIANLGADTPVLLLPVRIETRYAVDGTALLVRIMPDQVHIDAHETPLTAAENAAGRFYWQSLWDAPDDQATDVRKAAFAELARAFRPRRAAWIAFAMRPMNMGAEPRPVALKFPDPGERPHAWSRAALAELLPTRWTVTGYYEDKPGTLIPIFQKRTNPVARPLHAGPDPNDTRELETDEDDVLLRPALDDGMRWATDFAAAEAAGMAVRIADAEISTTIAVAKRSFAKLRIARLTVHGVADDLTAEEACARLERSLRAHRYADGLELVAPGTPTNNGDADAGFDGGDAAQTAAMDPFGLWLNPPEAVAALAAALGIDPAAAHLDRLRSAEFRDAETTRHMLDALWFATLGQTLDQFFDAQLDGGDIAKLKAFVLDNLRPGGPLPTVRIGRQPYGVLPIMPLDGYVGAEPVETRVAATIGVARGYWTNATTRAPYLAKPGQSLADNMRELLQHQPLAAHNRFRRVLGPAAMYNAAVDKKMAARQESARNLVFKALGVTPRVRMAAMTVEATNRALGAPFVQAKILDVHSGLLPNYLSTMIVESTMTGARDRLGKHGAGPSLLEALIGNALVYTYDHAIWYTLWTGGLVAEVGAATAVAAAPRNAVMPVSEFIGVEAATTTARGRSPRAVVASNDAVATMQVPGLTGTGNLADFIAGQLVAPTLTDMAAIQRLGTTINSVRALEHRPAAELDRVFRGILDAYSHRLDAWITALATARLRHWRTKRPGRRVGLGGFGWIEGLRPDKKPDSDGYIHAPSLHQAQTAAVLRSGHLAHRAAGDAAGAALAIDLSSRRVRLALGLLEGVGNGQPLAALLGYRFERMLREADIHLARHILPIRRLFPLNPAPAGAPPVQAEALAARDVVDGVKLMARRRAGGDWLAGVAPAVPAPARASIEAVVAEIDDMFDAVKDLLVAEGVHQLVGGNLERASAALAGLDRQTRPVDPEVIRTPRSGRSFAQRAGVILADEDPGGAWNGFSGGRALAEPRLNAWVGRLLGDPAAVRFGATLTRADGTARALEPVSLAELALDPLSVLFMATPQAGGRASELQERIAARMALQIAPAERDDEAELRLSGEDPVAGGIGLGTLEALLNRIRPVVTKHRPATATDLVPPGTEVSPGVRVDLLAARADAVLALMTTAKAALGDAIGPGDPDPEGLAAALDGCARAGAAGATPSEAGAEGDLAALLAQAEEVRRRLNAALAAEAKAAAGAAAASEDEDDHAAAVEAQVARLKALLGPGFPLLPLFELADAAAAGLNGSLASGEAMTAGEPAVLHGWLARMAEVKPRLAELAGCLAAVDMVAGSSADLRVAQLPHRPDARWIGLPLGKKTPDDVDLSLVLHAPGLDPAHSPALLAGLISDEWMETIPNAQETTAIAFNYDAPGARAPQTMLLAVHPDPAAAAWRPSQILACINAAADLARIRGVRPQDLDTLGGILPLVYLPEKFATGGSGINFAEIASAALAAKPSHLVNVLGKA